MPRRRPPPEPFTIAVDTREQLPYAFLRIENPKYPYTVERVTLQTGDYSVWGFHDPTIHARTIGLERKTVNDAFGSFGRNRKRFEAEIQRLTRYTYSAIIIEGEWSEILCDPPGYSRLLPKTVILSAIAWAQRYGVDVWTVPGRDLAEQLTYRILERFVDDSRTGTTWESFK